jgi:hypothetical protein
MSHGLLSLIVLIEINFENFLNIQSLRINDFNFMNSKFQFHEFNIVQNSSINDFIL